MSLPTAIQERVLELLVEEDLYGSGWMTGDLYITLQNQGLLPHPYPRVPMNEDPVFRQLACWLSRQDRTPTSPVLLNTFHEDGTPRWIAWRLTPHEP